MALSDDEQEKVEKFESKSAIPPKIGVVYGIYDSSGNCLYIGETNNFVSRFDNHFHHTGGESNIAKFVSSDDNPPVDKNNLWEETRIKFVVEPDPETRKRIESLLIYKNNPRYNRDRPERV